MQRAVRYAPFNHIFIFYSLFPSYRQRLVFCFFSFNFNISSYTPSYIFLHLITKTKPFSRHMLFFFYFFIFPSKVFFFIYFFPAPSWLDQNTFYMQMRDELKYLFSTKKIHYAVFYTYRYIIYFERVFPNEKMEKKLSGFYFFVGAKRWEK